MTFINQLFDFFLPRFCPSCINKLNADESFVCTACLSKLKLADDEFIHMEYKRKFANENIISDFHSLFVFEKGKEFQDIIHVIKYNENFRLGIFLGKLTAENFKNKINAWQPDCLIPIPLHHLKKAERGYNQSFYLAKGISKIIGIPVFSNSMSRTRFTPSQTNLNLKERKENIGGAFKLKDRSIIKGKKIILVDDVITTGATITECGKILINHGAQKVFSISAAIADL